MTESTSRDGYVVAERPGGEVAEGYWPFREGFAASASSPYTLASVRASRTTLELNAPFWPNRPPAPWRIKCRDGDWFIEERHTDHWEAHTYCATGAEAIATFDEESRR